MKKNNYKTFFYLLTIFFFSPVIVFSMSSEDALVYLDKKLEHLESNTNDLLKQKANEDATNHLQLLENEKKAANLLHKNIQIDIQAKTEEKKKQTGQSFFDKLSEKLPLSYLWKR